MDVFFAQIGSHNADHRPLRHRRTHGRGTHSRNARLGDQLASLDQGVVLTHEALIPDLREHIRTVTVTTMTFATLTAEVERIDLLHIDTEGHDAAILGQVDFERWTPAVIVYEHKHLSAEDADACRARLEHAGYSVHPLSGEDTFATRGLGPLRRGR